MEVYNKLIKKWSSSSIFFKPINTINPLNDILCLFVINIDKYSSVLNSGVILVYNSYVEIHIETYSKYDTYGTYFDIEYNFYNINAIIELVLKGDNIETELFEHSVLAKSRENKINAILNKII